MSKKKDYIKLEYNEYGYEIYIVSDNVIHKLKPQHKMMMYAVLKNYDRIKIRDNVFVYPNYKMIMLSYAKEKRKKSKKVNRLKSQQVVAGFLATVALITSLSVISSGSDNKEEVEEPEETVVMNDVQEEDSYNFEFSNSNMGAYYENVASNEAQFYGEVQEYNEVENIGYSEEIENVNGFYYDYETPGDKQALYNSQEYMDVFSKYERIYGIDANLLCAIGAQESSGIHHTVSQNGGYATGIMGIENIWDNGQIRVFNFENNCYETITVDYSRVGELDYNVKVGAAIFQSYFYSTLRNNDNVLEMDCLPFSLQKYNMGPGNMNKVLNCGGNWIDNREMINAGDSEYFEHVLSRLDNDTVISIRLDDGSYHRTKIVNTKLEYNHTRI